MTGADDALDRFEARLGHAFRDRALLVEALTHRSFANEHPGAPVGVLTPRRAALVSGPSLARWAEQLALAPHLRLGRGEQQTGGPGKESVLATALEAVVGAVYLDAGLPGARRVVASLAVW